MIERQTMTRVIAWFAPTVGTVLFYLIQALLVGGTITRLLYIMNIGQLFIGIGMTVTIFYLACVSPVFRLVTIGAHVIAVVLAFTGMTIVYSSGFKLLLAIFLWGLAFGIFTFRRDVTHVRSNVFTRKFIQEFKGRFSVHQFKRLVPVISIVGVLVIPGLVMFDAPSWNMTSRSFHVTASQARDIDLVFYYAGGPSLYSNYPDIIDLVKEFNVTLSLAWHLQYFNDTTPGTLGFEMANFTRRANTEGVKVEFFPCFHFNWEYILHGGFFEAVNGTYDWYDYWSLFKEWTSRENVTVDHVMWDMEGGSVPSDIAHIPMEYFYLPTTQIVGLNQRKRELPLIRQEFDRVLAETAAMGARTRITTWAPIDAMDGDHDQLLLLGQFGYVFDDLIKEGSIEYVSTMAYTNGWGDVHPDNGWGRATVYEMATLLRRLHPRDVGICIGNINGNGLTTIEDVINEYHLAIAGGATSVRLFNGASWVGGWDYAVVGPEWGVNGTRALFEACREGGTGTFTENQDRVLFIANDLRQDLILNLFRW